MAQAWLVTGSSRGLGHAIVEAGLAAGNKVLATAWDIKSLAQRKSIANHWRKQNRTVLTDYEVQLDRVVFYLWPSGGGGQFQFIFRPRFGMERDKRTLDSL
jgi:NAD(P)-dependent dehydrogenase (short-subunit alcohol dehydrogenase family)